jgi:Tfp pilus assembly protein PilF
MKLSEAHIAYGAVFAAAMAGYLLTLCPTVYVGDSGDFITASYNLGVAHPTGYPLYMIAGKLFSLIPVGNIAYRYNLMGAVFAALAAVFVCLSTRTLTKSWIAGVGAGLTAAFSQALWDQATVAEVYSLNGLFVALLVYLTLQWRQTKDGKTLAYIAAAYGLSLTNHLSMVVYAPAFAYLIAADNKKALKKAKAGALYTAFFAPLILYLYLPLRAASNPAYNWGNPSTMDRFIQHVTGYVHRQVAVWSLTSAQLFERFFGILSHYLRQFSLTGILVLVGLYRHGGRSRTFMRFTLLMLALDGTYALLLNEVSLDITTFCIPSIIVLAMWSGYIFTDTFQWMKKEGKDARMQYAAVALAVAVVFASNYYVNDKSRNYVAYDYGMNILKTVDRNAVIFAEGDNTVFPLSYLLLVEKARQEDNITLYERTGIISHRLYGMDYFFLDEEEHAKRRATVEYDVVKGGRPVYYMAGDDASFPGYRLQQTGLLYRVVGEDDTLPERDYWGRYDTRQVMNATIYRDTMTLNIVEIYYARLADQYSATDKDAALRILADALKIKPDNMYARYGKGKILLAKGDYKGAYDEFMEAVSANPKSPQIHNNIGYSLIMRGEKEAALREYRIALQLDPYYIKARHNLAVFLVGQGRYTEAADQYKFIVKNYPEYAKGYFDLGRIYYSANKTKEAAGLWEHYLELNPKDPMAKDIMGKIAEITSGEANAAAAGNGTSAGG